VRPKDDKKIEAIYSATLHLNEQLGFTGMTMAKIAKEAEIATGTLYIYFKNKGELINSLYLHLKRQKAKNLMQDLLLEQPYKILFKDLFMRSMKNSMADFRESAFLEQYFRSPFIDEGIKAEGMQPFLPIFEIIEEAKKAMILKDVDTTYIFACMNGLLNEFTKSIKEEQIKWNEKSAETMFQMLWDALKS
jgi:AcrR family transcriptional regulator